MIHPPSNTRTKTHTAPKKGRMGDEQVQRLLCLLKHYACLCLLLFPAYLQIDGKFSQGDKTSTPRAALPVPRSAPSTLAYAQSSSAICSPHHQKKGSSSTRLPHFLSSPHQNGTQLPLQTFWNHNTADTGSFPKLFSSIRRPEHLNLHSKTFNDLSLADACCRDSALLGFHPPENSHRLFNQTLAVGLSPQSGPL